MIITRLTGGLGNQMFQYAAGLALAEARQTELKLDLEWFDAGPHKPHERYGLACFQIPEPRASVDEIARLCAPPPASSRLQRCALAVARRLRLHGYVRRHASVYPVRYDGDFSFDPVFPTWPDATYLHGNWQSENYFAFAAARVRARFAFREPPPATVARLAARIAARPAICVHVRRGDYVHDPVYARENGALCPAYYRRALAEMRQRAPGAPIYVFSDEIATVAREFDSGGEQCEFVQEPAGTAPHDTLRLMSLASHFVIANSTLSWWAAWLGRRDGSVVIAPEPWFASGPRNGRDIVPDSWIRLPRAE